MKYIPIDFIKAEVIGLSPDLFESNPLLSDPVSIFNGELLTKTIYSYKNLKIKIFEGSNRIEFLGSLHTFYNNGKHNHNQFTYCAFRVALGRLNRDLGIEPHNLYLLHLEWGFNLKPLTTAKYITDRCIQHLTVNKTVGIDCKIEGHYIQFKHSNYILKIYDKGKHFNLDKEVIRIEMKQTNWSEFRLSGIRTLADFIGTDKQPFLDLLIKQWERVILYDINEDLSNDYVQYQTCTFWDTRRKKYSNKNFKYHLDKLKSLNEEIGFNSQQYLINQIIKKGNELQL